jgi:hypothetical protein
MGEISAYQTLLGTYEKKRSLRKPRCRWNDNKFGFKEMVRWSGLD